jgi:hypothetical protein
VDLTATLDAPCTPDVLFGWVDDLGRYPQWLAMVTRADAVDEITGDPGPAWKVELRGRIGPLARSKRLRMVRSVVRPGSLVVFERIEGDGRHHSDWVLQAEVAPSDSGSRLVMRLHYSGGLWGPVLERALTEEIAEGRQRLLELTTGEAA